jgi:hypothetical protein
MKSLNARKVQYLRADIRSLGENLRVKLGGQRRCLLLWCYIFRDGPHSVTIGPSRCWGVEGAEITRWFIGPTFYFQNSAYFMNFFLYSSLLHKHICSYIYKLIIYYVYLITGTVHSLPVTITKATAFINYIIVQYFTKIRDGVNFYTL